tara:strand:- start:477 stop:1472 length:996 start_codon:yes stop_codon:yes gene_type:complete
MEQSKLTIRVASSVDAEKICLLFKRVAPEHERGIDFWVWINRMLSEEDSIIAVAEYEGEIIGHYAIIPQKIIISEAEYNTGLGIHAIIQEDKNDLVSIYEISNLAYREAKRIGLKFIYGFPNKNYRLIQEKIERWKIISLFRAYETDISNYKLNFKLNSFIINKLNKTFESFYELSKLIDTNISNTSVNFKKSLNYYVNRYLNHPQGLYNSYKVIDIFGNKACLFLKEYQDTSTGIKKGHLIDFIKEEEFDVKALLDIAVLILKERKIGMISFWPMNKRIKEIFNAIKVEPCGFETFLGVKFLNKEFEKEHKEELLNIENWTLNMGDSDAF